MTASILLYNPTAVRSSGAETASQTLASIKGKVVGFIDNAKPNFDHLVDDLAELLTTRYGVAKIIKMPTLTISRAVTRSVRTTQAALMSTRINTGTASACRTATMIALWVELSK